jgi:hypothetical protein
MQVTKEMGYYDKIQMIQRLDERRSALKDFAQYSDVIKNIDRLISMIKVTLDEPSKELQR